MNNRICVLLLLSLLFCTFAASAWSNEAPKTSYSPFTKPGDTRTACFPDSDHQRHTIVRWFSQPSSSLRDFIRSVGHHRVEIDDLRLLTDEDDWAICTRLNDINSGFILARQGERGADYAAPAADYDIAYYQLANLYVVIITEAHPVSGIDGIDIARVGGPVFLTIYSAELKVLWSPISG